MNTPYESHKQLSHEISRMSPNSIDIIEECSTCGARFLMPNAFNAEKHPISLRNANQSYIDKQGIKRIKEEYKHLIY